VVQRLQVSLESEFDKQKALLTHKIENLEGARLLQMDKIAVLKAENQDLDCQNIELINGCLK
jgi:hypothetical protein